MNISYFISYQKLTEASGLNENFSAEVLRPIIKEVQDMKIKPVIGKELFKRLEAGIQADDLTSDEKELLNDYIADALINFIMADLPYRSKYKFSNVGFMEMTAENTTPVPGNEVDKVVSYYANKASFYANRITEYLDDNRETFPLYKPNCNNSGQYNTGIYLG